MKLPEIAYTPKPVTAERIERALDVLARIMIELGEEGLRCLPIYERLEKELAAIKSGQDKMAAVQERAKRSKDQTAEIAAGRLPRSGD